MNDFDPIRDSVIIGITMFGFLFGLAIAISACDTKRKLHIDHVLVVLAHVIFIPYLVVFTMWCYDHGERIDALPDAWQYDMRLYWPFLAVLDGAFLLWYIPLMFQPSRVAMALKLMERSHQLRAEGKHQEAEIAWAKANRLLGQ